MPVASFVATGTACGRHSVAASARGLRERLFSQAPHPFPSALFKGVRKHAAGRRCAVVSRSVARYAMRAGPVLFLTMSSGRISTRVTLHPGPLLMR